MAGVPGMKWDRVSETGENQIVKRVIIGLLLTLFGGGIVSWGSRPTLKSAPGTGWSTVSGTVLLSRVVDDTIRDRDGTTTVYHQADVRYRFVVNGASYESNVFIHGGAKSFADKAQAEKLIAARPVGGALLVYYDPANPARSSLELPRTTAQDIGIPTLTGGLFVLIGMMLFISGAIGWARSELIGR